MNMNKEVVGQRTKCCSLFIAQVFLAIGALVLLAFTVGALPVREEPTPPKAAEGQQTPRRMYGDRNNVWSLLTPEERLAIIEDVERHVGSSVGQIYMALGTPDSAYRSTQTETHLFDTYGLMLPGSSLPNVLLCPAVSTDPDEPAPPFQTPPLSNVEIKSDIIYPDVPGEPLEVMPAELGSADSNRKIPGFVYYNGVPILVPKALGKISIKMSLLHEMIGLRHLK